MIYYDASGASFTSQEELLGDADALSRPAGKFN